jgi:dTDP-4-amino-4,6-dideoxygalactose transaminase
MKVPLMRPSLPNKEDYIKIVDELWESRMLSNFSKYSKLMEQTAKEQFNSDRHFLSCVSCDVSLMLLLRCFNFPKGSHVLVPSFTFNSTINAIVWNDLVPVFVDIDPSTYTISPSDVDAKVGDKTVAIMGVHIFGNPCDMGQLEYLAKAHDLKLIIDAAHGYGSKYQGRHICEFGDAGAYSFSGTKLITSAEGGLTFIKDPEIAERFYKARNYGFEGDYNTQLLGMNGKISEFHAGLAYLSMQNIDSVMARRQEIAKRYREGIKGLEFQTVRDGDLSSYKDFSILTPKRDEVYEKLAEKGIQTKKYFFPNHMTRYHRLPPASLPNTEAVYDQILCIPIFNDITDEQIQYVIDSINGL